MSDIVERLRHLLAREQDAGEVMEEAAAELERLRAEKIQPIDLDLRNNLRLARDTNAKLQGEVAKLRGILRLQDAAVRSGVTPTLTDAEREAVWFAIAYAQNAGHECEATLRGLLKRIK